MLLSEAITGEFKFLKKLMSLSSGGVTDKNSNKPRFAGLFCLLALSQFTPGVPHWLSKFVADVELYREK